MESYLEENFVVKKKISSEKALGKWRKVATLVKALQKWRFESAAIHRSNEIMKNSWSVLEELEEMEIYLVENFVVKPKTSSGKALEKWRKVATLVEALQKWRLSAAIHRSNEEQLKTVKPQAKHSAHTDSAPALHQGPQPPKPIPLEVVFLVTNIFLEDLLLTLDQFASPDKPQYAEISLVVSWMIMVVCLAELFYKGRQQRNQGIRYWLRYPYSDDNPYTFFDVFSMAAAFSQVISSFVACKYLSSGRENPIKVSFNSVIFITCYGCSKLFNNPPNEMHIPIQTRDA